MENLSAEHVKIFIRMATLGICTDFMTDDQDDSLMTDNEIRHFEKYCNKVEKRQKGCSLRELSHFLSLHCIRQDSTGRCLSAAMKAGLPITVHHNATQNTPLHVAAYRGFPAVVQIALDAEVDVSALDGHGMEALFYAIQGKMNQPGIGSEEDYFKIFKMITKAKGGVDKCLIYTRGGGKRSYIFLACESGAQRIVSELIKAGADVNEKDSQLCDSKNHLDPMVTSLGQTPLHLAVKSGNLKLVKMLLKKGANTRARTLDHRATLPVEQVLNGGFNMRIANEIFRWEEEHEIDCDDSPEVARGMIHASDSNVKTIKEWVKTFLETGEITGNTSSMPIFCVQSDKLKGAVERVENELESKIISKRKCEYCCMELPDLKKCSRCKSVHYCSVTCQKDDWADHKKVCVKVKE